MTYTYAYIFKLTIIITQIGRILLRKLTRVKKGKGREKGREAAGGALFDKLNKKKKKERQSKKSKQLDRARHDARVWLRIYMYFFKF